MTQGLAQLPPREGIVLTVGNQPVTGKLLATQSAVSF